MKLGRGGAAGLLLAGTLWGGACDDHSDVPPEVLNPQAERPAEETTPTPARPTTQELVEGPRVPMMLEGLPLLLQVPPQWRITRHGSGGQMVWLEGPTPAGEAHIQLKAQQPMPVRIFDQLISGTRRELERDSDGPGVFLDYRRLGPAHVIERRSVRKPITTPLVDELGMPALDSKGDVVMHTMIPVRWWINVYVPGEEGYVEDYQLNFIDLEKPQYEADREFLEGILNTLRYTGTVVGSPDDVGSEPSPADDPPAAR